MLQKNIMVVSEREIDERSIVFKRVMMVRHRFAKIHSFVPLNSKQLAVLDYSRRISGLDTSRVVGIAEPG